MTKPQVTADAHQDRSAAVSAAVTEIAAKLAADEANLRKNSDQLKRAAEHEIAAVHARAAAKKKQLHDALLADYNRVLPKLVAAYIADSTRAAAAALGEALSPLIIRCERELGEAFDFRTLAFTFSDYLLSVGKYPNAVNVFGRGDFIASGAGVLEVVEGIPKVISEPALLCATLERLERALLDHARSYQAQYAPIQANVQRFAICKAHLTYSQRHAALQAFDQQNQVNYDQARLSEALAAQENPVAVSVINEIPTRMPRHIRTDLFVEQG